MVTLSKGESQSLGPITLNSDLHTMKPSYGCYGSQRQTYTVTGVHPPPHTHTQTHTYKQTLTLSLTHTHTHIANHTYTVHPNICRHKSPHKSPPPPHTHI